MILRYLEIEGSSHHSEIIDPRELEVGYNYFARVMPIQLEMDISPLPKGCLVKGSFAFEAILPCARCLEDVALNGKTSFSTELKPRSALKVPQTEEEEVDLDETDEIFPDGDVFDTWELVKEQTYLLLPGKVLCKEDCKGLCPQCGADLNKTECKCPKTLDPRFSVLTKLFE